MDYYRPKRGNLLGLLLWTVILSVIMLIILIFWKPEIIQKTNAEGEPIGELDTAKTILASIIVALTIVLIIYLLSTSGVSKMIPGSELVTKNPEDLSDILED